MGEHLDDGSLLALLVKRAMEKTATSRATTVMLVEGRGLQDGAGAVVELPREALAQIECHAERQDVNGNITRWIPEKNRRAVLARDHNRCRNPSCHSPHALEVHHIQPFSEGGTHDVDNLVTLCWFHHRAHHFGQLRIFVENGTVKFARIEPVGAVQGSLRKPRRPTITRSSKQPKVHW